ncbi:MAG: hypothetical protein ACLSCV_02220 [Acutalibacteraceae bacterium]
MVLYADWYRYYTVVSVYCQFVLQAVAWAFVWNFNPAKVFMGDTVPYFRRNCMRPCLWDGYAYFIVPIGHYLHCRNSICCITSIVL